MSELTENFAELGSYGPDYPGEEDHAQEWYFDLDLWLSISRDSVYIDQTVTGGHTGVKVRDLDNPGQTVYIGNGDFSQVKYGVKLYATGDSYIYDVEFNDVESSDKFGGAFMIGTREYPTQGITFIKNVYGDGKDQPLTSYDTSNTDFLIVERGSAPVYLKYATGMNFSDAIIDAKSTVYIMNATLEGAHRILRAWDNVEIIIVNSIVNAPPGEDLIWFADSTSTIKYFNVLWNGQPHPDPSLISGNGSLVALTENPLPAISSFFDDEVAMVTFEFSTDGGVTWEPLPGGQFGTPGAAIIGDIRFDVNLPLEDSILVRALVERTDGSQALSGGVKFDGPVGSVTLDLADFDLADVSTGVAPVNAAPEAGDDFADADQDTLVAGNVLANDQDPDGDPLSVNEFSVGGTDYAAGATAAFAEGELTINADGSWSFAPATGYTGTVPLATYTVFDGATSSTATLSIMINPTVDDTTTDGAVTGFSTAINIGGGAYTDSNGILYQADPGVSAGRLHSSEISRPITGTMDDAQFMTYGFGKQFSYDIDVPANGQYLMRIDLIEPKFDQSEKRVFDIYLEGAVPTEFDDIDIVELSGGQYNAITLFETVTVTDGVLDIDFVSIKHHAIISGISIFDQDAILG